MPDVAALIGPLMPMAAVAAPAGYAVVIPSLKASYRSLTRTFKGVVCSVARVLGAAAADKRDWEVFDWHELTLNAFSTVL